MRVCSCIGLCDGDGHLGLACSQLRQPLLLLRLRAEAADDWRAHHKDREKQVRASMRREFLSRARPQRVWNVNPGLRAGPGRQFDRYQASSVVAVDLALIVTVLGVERRQAGRGNPDGDSTLAGALMRLDVRGSPM